MCHISKLKIPKPNNTEDEDTSDECEDPNRNHNERFAQKPVQANANTDPNGNKRNGVNANLRRSTRIRKQPERYGQTLPSNIVS